MMEMEAPLNVEVGDIKDLARLAASVVSMGQPIYLIGFKHMSKYYYGLLGVYNHYYEKQGIPLFYHCASERPLSEKTKYLLAKMDEREEIVFSEGTKPGWIAIPIVNLKEKPEFLELKA